MNKRQFKSGQGYSEADWNEVSSTPELTEAEIATARPFAEVFPELAATIRRGRPKLAEPAKRQVTLRLDIDIIERFKATGPKWQSRINAALRKAM